MLTLEKFLNISTMLWVTYWVLNSAKIVPDFNDQGAVDEALAKIWVILSDVCSEAGVLECISQRTANRWRRGFTWPDGAAKLHRSITVGGRHYCHLLVTLSGRPRLPTVVPKTLPSPVAS